MPSVSGEFGMPGELGTTGELSVLGKLSKLNLLNRLKGKDRFETMENYSISGVIFGALMFAAGVGLTAISTQGIPAIVSMLGAVVAFCASVALVFVWLAKEIVKKEE